MDASTKSSSAAPALLEGSCSNAPRPSGRQAFMWQEIPLAWLKSMLKVLPGHSKPVLMQCSKLLAHLVVEANSEPPTLHLWQYTFDEQACRPSKAAYQLTISLAQAAPKLHLNLGSRMSEEPHHLSVVAKLPVSHIVHLRLYYATVTTGLLRGMQLQRWHQLRTIAIDSCTMNTTSADAYSLAQTRSAWLPQSFATLDMHCPTFSTEAGHIVQAFCPGTLKMLVKVFRPAESPSIILRTVTHLEMYWVTNFDKLLRLPALRHVKCNRLEMRQDQRQLPCRLPCLEIMHGGYVEHIARVPAGVQKIVVHRRLQGSSESKAVTQFASGPPVVCVAKPAYDCHGHPVYEMPAFRLHGPFCPEVISKIASSLQGCLYFNGFYGIGITLPDACLPSLGQLPAAVTKLCFTPLRDDDDDDDELPAEKRPDRVQYWCQLVQALPAHIRQLQLYNEYAKDHRDASGAGQDAVALIKALGVLQRSLVVLLGREGKQLADMYPQHVEVLEAPL